MSFQVERAGSAALKALRGGTATVFASFERSCYVETPAGIACLGGPGLGMGPLNAILERFENFSIGSQLYIETGNAERWNAPSTVAPGRIPDIQIPESIKTQAQIFLDWIAGSGEPDDALIGRGRGLTPAGDDFVGGAMIALRAYGNDLIADRVAKWALPLAKDHTNRISRAHLECAAQGEGHEALHDLLCTFDEKHLDRLARIGHTSGLDAAAGALLGLTCINMR